MLINYNDIPLIKSLMDGTATREDIFWLNSRIDSLEHKHEQYIQKRNKFYEAILTALEGTNKYFYHPSYQGKTANEIRQEISKILNTEITLPMVSYALRILVNDKKVVRHEGTKHVISRVNYYGKSYKPDVVFTLYPEE